MTDMLPLFDETTPDRLAWINRQAAVRRSAPVAYFECCGRRFISFPAFLGHVGPSHPVMR